MSVAVIIAAYNAEDTITPAVRSCLAQDGLSQLIVIDDGSEDRTSCYARACAPHDPRLVVHRLERNRGPSAARNRALALATTDWVCIVDADDFVEPGRLDKMLNESRGYDLIADNLVRLSPAHGRRHYAWTIDSPRDISFREFVEANVTERNQDALELGFAKPLIRRDFLLKRGLSYNETLRLGEDFDLYARALALGARMKLIPAAGYVSVERTDSLSKRHTTQDLAALLDASRSLQCLRKFEAHERRALRQHALSIEKRLQWRRLIDAVKTRDLYAGLRTMRSPPVALHLLTQLADQAWRRWLGLTS